MSWWTKYKEQGTPPKHFLSLSIPTTADYFFFIKVLHCTLLLKICHQSEPDPQLPTFLISSGIIFWLCSCALEMSPLKLYLSITLLVSRQMVPPVTGNIRSVVHTWSAPPCTGAVVYSQMQEPLTYPNSHQTTCVTENRTRLCSLGGMFFFLTF